MNINTKNAELLRLIRNLIRTGVVIDVDIQRGCRVQTGNLQTDWLPWLTQRAGSARQLWPPSIGEQVVILSMAGELTTGIVLAGIFSDKYHEPTNSLTANHVTYPDGAVIEYEPETGALTATGVTTALIDAREQITANASTVIINASDKIQFNTPTVICSHNLTCATLNVIQGGEMSGDINHSGGTIKSNGITLHSHTHAGVKSGGDSTGNPQ
ncbi:phage baseplate assembly protein V [Arsenophonus apicola]|uniref:Phage baseplate assembly protein V n=1 Tax=Arsenophonus apicola TaxID=2879119 RepID=A0ABY8P5A3_9GAMM|nr:phage baseplate assembly protein V [Arsenophonus apicola]WGO84673.1 phage baseplate assembly protein V [Arsenophonus apicola]